MTKSCLRPCSSYAQSLCFVCVCCVRLESICHTHTWSHVHCHTSIILIMNDQSRVSLLSFAPSVSHVEHVYLDGLVISSSSHASVCSYHHVCIFWLFTHLVILLKVGWPDSSLTTRPSPTFRLDQLSTRTAQKHQASPFKLRCRKHINQLSCWPPRQSDPTVTPRLTPLKISTEAINLTRSTNWQNCVDRLDRHQVPVPVSFRKLRIFPSESSR